MKQSYFEVVSNKNIAKNVYEAVLIGDTSEIKRPGQFVNIKLDGNKNESKFHNLQAYGTNVVP